MSKKRIFVRIEGNSTFVPIAWYSGTAETTIKNLIKQVSLTMACPLLNKLIGMRDLSY